VSDETTRDRPTPADLAHLDPGAFRRAMLAGILSDIEVAREKRSMSVVVSLTSQAVRLRTEIAAAEEAERASSLSLRSTDELVEDLVATVAQLPDPVVDRILEAVAQRRSGRPRMRVVPQSS
jgi:hypothetical protein